MAVYGQLLMQQVIAGCGLGS